MTTRVELPRWGIVSAALRLPIEHSGAALRNAPLPFLMLVAMHRLTAIVEPAGLQLVAWQFLYVAVFPIPAALLLVPWYRLILSAQRPELADRPARWWYVAFMIRTLCLEMMLFVFHLPSLIANVLAVQDGGASDPQLARLTLILLAALAPGFYLYARLALVLPAAAGAADDSYARSWRMTAGAGWRVAGIVFALWFMFLLLDGAVAGIPPGILAATTDACIDVVRELAMAAAIALVYVHYDRTPIEDVFN